MSKAYVLVDSRAFSMIGQALTKRGFTPIAIPVHDTYDAPISAHPDVFAFVDGNTIIADAETTRMIKEQTLGAGDRLFIEARSEMVRHVVYPADCTLNAAICGDVLIGKKESLDDALIRYAEKRGLRIADVRQGYANCNCAVISENALITEDVGIANICRQFGLDVLLLHTHAVTLNGYEYGFIGGACGLFEHTLYVVGDITRHPEYDAIEKFTSKHGVTINVMCDGDVTDVGSLLFF